MAQHAAGQTRTQVAVVGTNRKLASEVSQLLRGIGLAVEADSQAMFNVPQLLVVATNSPLILARLIDDARRDARLARVPCLAAMVTEALNPSEIDEPFDVDVLISDG